MKITLKGKTPHPPEAKDGFVILKNIRNQKDRYLANSARTTLVFGVVLPAGVYLVETINRDLRPSLSLYSSDGETPFSLDVRNEATTGIPMDDGEPMVRLTQVQCKDITEVSVGTPAKAEKGKQDAA